MSAASGRTRLATLAASCALALCGAAPRAGAQMHPPSFDCGMVVNAVEELICNDPELARLDRAAADAFQATLRRIQPAEVPRHEVLLGEWLIERNACREEDDVRSCVHESYVRRLVAIRNLVVAAAPAALLWYCNDDRRLPFYTTFYDDTDPPSVMLIFGDDEAVATIQPSGSGARYAGPGIEFSQHGREAKVRWRGWPLVCTR